MSNPTPCHHCKRGHKHAHRDTHVHTYVCIKEVSVSMKYQFLRYTLTDTLVLQTCRALLSYAMTQWTLKLKYCISRPVANTLKIIPIIPSRTFQKCYRLFFFILISLPIILVLFPYCSFQTSLPLDHGWIHLRLPSEFKVKSFHQNINRHFWVHFHHLQRSLRPMKVLHPCLPSSLTIHYSDYSYIMFVNVV